MATLNNVRTVVGFHDLKKKRGNGGGISDGGLANPRESLSTTAVLIGPPPGKAWQMTPGGNEFDFESGFYVFNFDTVAALVDVSLVLEDGTEVPLSLGSSVTAGQVDPFEVPQILAYPMKLKVRTQEDHDKRVLFAGLFTEFDLPKE